MRHRAPQRSPEGAGPDRCPSPAARAGAPQLLQNPFEPQSAGPWQLPPVAMLNHRSSDLGMPLVSQHISGLVLEEAGNPESAKDSVRYHGRLCPPWTVAGRVRPLVRFTRPLAIMPSADQVPIQKNPERLAQRNGLPRPDPGDP